MASDVVSKILAVNNKISNNIVLITFKSNKSLQIQQAIGDNIERVCDKLEQITNRLNTLDFGHITKDIIQTHNSAYNVVGHDGNIADANSDLSDDNKAAGWEIFSNITTAITFINEIISLFKNIKSIKGWFLKWFTPNSNTYNPKIDLDQLFGTGSTVTDNFGKIRTWFNTAWSTVSNGLGTWWSKVTTYGSQIVATVTTLAKSSKLSSIISTVVSQADKIFAMFYNIATVVLGLLTGIQFILSLLKVIDGYTSPDNNVVVKDDEVDNPLPGLLTFEQARKVEKLERKAVLDDFFTAVMSSVIKDAYIIGSLIGNAYSAIDSFGKKYIDNLNYGINRYKETSSGLRIPTPISGLLQTQYPSLTSHANGTQYHTGGIALVGERGPELVHLPTGSSVTTAERTRKLGGNVTVNNYITVTSAERSDEEIAEVVAYRIMEEVDNAW